MFLRILQHSQENTCARVSFLIKLQALCFNKKETLAQVFSCECCEISQNTFFKETFRWLLLKTNNTNQKKEEIKELTDLYIPDITGLRNLSK